MRVILISAKINCSVIDLYVIITSATHLFKFINLTKMMCLDCFQLLYVPRSKNQQ